MKLEVRRDPNAPKKNKFNAKRTEYNGEMYDSEKEAGYAQHLQYLKHMHDVDKRVTKIERQVPFHIKIKNHHCFTYILDFRVTYGDLHVEYVDVKGLTKGAVYDLFRVKKACVQAEYGIEIKEI